MAGVPHRPPGLDPGGGALGEARQVGLRPPDDGLDQLVGADLPGVAEQREAPDDRDVVRRVGDQRDEGARGVGEVAQPLARRGEVPVDEGELAARPEDQVPGREVVVAERVGLAAGGAIGLQAASGGGR